MEEIHALIRCIEIRAKKFYVTLEMQHVSTVVTSDMLLVFTEIPSWVQVGKTIHWKLQKE